MGQNSLKLLNRVKCSCKGFINLNPLFLNFKLYEKNYFIFTFIL